MPASASARISCAAAQIAFQLAEAAKRSASGCSRAYSIDRSRNCCEPPATSGCGKQPADLLEAVGHLLQALTDGVFHWRRGILRAGGGCDKAPAEHPGERQSIVIGIHPGWADMSCIDFGCAAGCCGSVATAQQAGAGDPNALTVLAEIALERGDCKGAAETYAAAAPKGSVELAKRASEVALACEHLPAAWESAQRWRALAPNDIDAAAIYATIALKLYHIPEAQACRTHGGAQ